MKKYTIIWALLVLLMCSCVSKNSDTNLVRIERINTHCHGITSLNENTSRKAVRKCRSGDVLKAILYYHPDFGTRLEVAKMCKNIKMLKKARVFAKKSKPKNDIQKVLRSKLSRLLSKKLKAAKNFNSIDKLALANDFKEKPLSTKDVIEMEDFAVLVDIFLYYSDFKLKNLALEKIYAISSFIPQNMSYSKAKSKIETAKEDIKSIIKRFFPIFIQLKASNENQENYKKNFLTELQSIHDKINPDPGQEAYVDRGTFLRNINIIRKKNGLRPIRYDDCLNESALKWAKYHYDNKLSSLKRKHGKSSFRDKIADEGCNYKSSSANLTRLLIPNAKNLLTKWNDVSEERGNILNEKYASIGLACAYAPLKNKKAKYICIQLLAGSDIGE